MFFPCAFEKKKLIIVYLVMANLDETDCIACFAPVPTDGTFIKCFSCKHAYHLDACSGIADRTFRSMGGAKREKWICRTCRNRESRSVIGTTGEAVLPPEDDAVSAHLAQINVKLELLHSLKANVDRLCELPAKVDDLLSLRPSVDAMKETIKGLQESVGKCESMMQLVTANDKEVKLLRSEVEVLQTTVTDQTAIIEQLQANVNSSEQYSRRCNMEIHGIPCANGEDLSVTMADLAVKLGLATHTPDRVVACHRLSSRHEGAAPILVQFTSVSVKEHWMNARKKLATLSRSENQQRIYFNENLTRTNKDLFWQARNKGREKSYKFVWVKNSAIFAKKDENSSPVRISSTRDLGKIV